MQKWLLLVSACLSLVAAQTPVGREVHPKITTYECSRRRGCVPQKTHIVLDALSHPVKQKANPSLGCGNWGEAPPKDICPDEKTCAKNCILEAIDDYSKYGVTTKGSTLNLEMLRPDGSVATPRVYLLSVNKNKYQMLKLTGNEFTFDVDVSKLPCGMNGALYLSEMDERGGREKLNKSGAYHGSGYCDAQCFTTPFINGVANIEGKGSCCNEMDIWEANARASHIAPHPCSKPGLFRCTGEECAFEGDCDKWGCGYNPYKLGNPDYYGPNGDVDTTRPFTVITQFPANKKGELQQIKRMHIQDGKLIYNAAVNVTGPPPVDYMDAEYCSTVIGEGGFDRLGGMVEMGNAMSRGMVLAMSIWWDEGGAMQWLDGASTGAGPCNATEGFPAAIRQIEAFPKVSFSNIKWGEMGTTFKVPKPKPGKPGKGGKN